MPSWNAEQYLKFAKERTRPAHELAARVPLEAPVRVIDLGCGPGNSTQVLHKRWPKADLTGLDSSAEMLAKAAKDHPFWHWIEADVSTWSADKPFDLIFSNATFQWVPNHAQIFPHLLMQVAGGGALAIQMPYNQDAPSHRVIRETAEEPVWRERMTHALRLNCVLKPSEYYNIISPYAQHVDIWETVYYHVMPDAAAILEWIKGTGMRPFLDALDTEEEKKRFEQHCLQGLYEAYPPTNNGHVLFPFRRLFMVACC